MALEGPSWTAMACARARALHMRLDGQPWIYEDKIAAALVDLEQQIANGLDLEEQMLPLVRPGRGVFVVRERFCEDALAEAATDGATQYVVLGAGLNSFAYSGIPLASEVKVFEVDHPSTQNWKRSRLREIGETEPNNLSYVPIDFECEVLGERLVACGFDRSSPAVFAWNGVTQYLPDKAIDKTLTEVLNLASGRSVLAMQITLPKELVGDEDKKALDRVMTLSAGHGERWVNSHDPKELNERLRSMGFADVEIFSPAATTARYLGGRKDGLTVAGYFAMVKATTT